MYGNEVNVRSRSQNKIVIIIQLNEDVSDRRERINGKHL